MKRFSNRLAPPGEWRFPVLLLTGIFFGLSLAIFKISNASSYLSDNPAACMNCHVMTGQFASWQKSSHARVANCNDCHVPHDNFIRKYLFKAMDGTRHAAMFTLRLEPEVIHMKNAGVSVVQENCIRCHHSLINSASIVSVTRNSSKHGAGKLCWECHRETPHGRVNGLSSFPFVRVPRSTPVLPEWMNKIIVVN